MPTCPLRLRCPPRPGQASGGPAEPPAVRGGRLRVTACSPSLLLLLEIPHTLGVWPELERALEPSNNLSFMSHLHPANCSPPLCPLRVRRGCGRPLVAGVSWGQVASSRVTFPLGSSRSRLPGWRGRGRSWAARMHNAGWRLPSLRISKAFFPHLKNRQHFSSSFTFTGSTDPPKCQPRPSTHSFSYS